MILKAYELVNNAPATTVVYDQKSELQVKAEITKKDNQISINVETSKAYSVVLVNITNVVSVENGKTKVKGNDTVITPDGSGEVICKLN